jgi:hypothetical protein
MFNASAFTNDGSRLITSPHQVLELPDGTVAWDFSPIDVEIA